MSGAIFNPSDKTVSRVYLVRLLMSSSIKVHACPNGSLPQCMVIPNHSLLVTAHLVTESLGWPNWPACVVSACLSPVSVVSQRVVWWLADAGWLYFMTQGTSVLLYVTSQHAAGWFDLVVLEILSQQESRSQCHTPFKPVSVLCSLIPH